MTATTEKTIADELRAAVVKLRETAAVLAADCGQEWRPWHVIQNRREDNPAVLTGTVTVARDRYVHDQEEEEDWYEIDAVADSVRPPVGAWIALMHPGLAEPFATLLDKLADDMTSADAIEGTTSRAVHPVSALGVLAPRDDWTAALAVARVVNGGDRD